MSIRRIRSALREGRYLYSNHALEEMDDDKLLESDVLEVIMRGKIIAKLTSDSRGPWCAELLLKGKLKSKLFADSYLPETCV